MADPHAITKQHFTEVALQALTETDRVLETPDNASEKTSPSEMHAYAIDPEFQASPALLNALKTDTRVRSDFQRLLTNTARYYLPQVAAASSGDIEQREADGCKISFRPSRADDSHIYAIIESIGDTSFNPSLLFVCGNDTEPQRMELPDSQNGRIQLLLERKSDMAKALLDIKSEVYLK